MSVSWPSGRRRRRSPDHKRGPRHRSSPPRSRFSPNQKIQPSLVFHHLAMARRAGPRLDLSEPVGCCMTVLVAPFSRDGITCSFDRICKGVYLWKTWVYEMHVRELQVQDVATELAWVAILLCFAGMSFASSSHRGASSTGIFYQRSTAMPTLTTDSRAACSDLTCRQPVQPVQGEQ